MASGLAILPAALRKPTPPKIGTLRRLPPANAAPE
jgi:hypothetical protein